MKNRHPTFALLTVAVASLLMSAAQAHIRVSPTESTMGALEKYVMRVPNEKQIDTVRIEGEFPAGARVMIFEQKPGWKFELRKNDKGDLVGITWNGVLKPQEYIEIGMLTRNPKDQPELVWKFVQHYADGSKEEFAGAPGSRLPAPVIKLNPAPPANTPPAATPPAH